ncbi:erythromycin esterase family protein [Phytomonospora sp. NPDC050363]|uniref:erythromycin esterase family protein n=1 Tax=Phytomonospora sp. NPDC050363 TaxID=3155642 RepID=UPI00340ED6ED
MPATEKTLEDLVPPSCELLGLGEPTHLEPAFARHRNELFEQLATLTDLGFRSFAIESDRIAGLAVDDYVREGVGTLDSVMSEGFSHEFGKVPANRTLVAWLRDHNEGRPPAERISFHGFDFQTETVNAPSPRTYLEHARDFLKLDLDIAGVAGDDEKWHRTESIMDSTKSPGRSAEAARLRAIAEDLRTALNSRDRSHPAWHRARLHLEAGIDLLRYHRQSAEQMDETRRICRLSAMRDGIMAKNLLDIRERESHRGPTLVYAHNRHLQKNFAQMTMGPYNVTWPPAGALIAPILGDRYAFIAGSLGSSSAIELGEPPAGTYEAALQRPDGKWSLTTVPELGSAQTRTDTNPMQGYFPLDTETLDQADALLHVTGPR